MQKQSKPTDEQFNFDFRWLMSSERGRRIVYRLLSKAGVYRSSIGRGLIPDIPLDMAYAEGQRSIGLSVMKMIELHCPERYSQMMKEAKNGRPDERTGNGTDTSHQP